MSLTDNLCGQRARKGTRQGVKREDRGFVGVCGVECLQVQESPPGFKTATKSRLTLASPRVTEGLSFPKKAELAASDPHFQVKHPEVL